MNVNSIDKRYSERKSNKNIKNSYYWDMSTSSDSCSGSGRKRRKRFKRSANRSKKIMENQHRPSQDNQTSTSNDNKEKRSTSNIIFIIQLFSVLNLFASSILSFIYLFITVTVVTFFMPLCGTIFGTPTEELSSFGRPETTQVDFLIFNIEIPVVSYSKDGYNGQNGRNGESEGSMSAGENNTDTIIEECTADSNKILAHLDSMNSKALITMLIFTLGFLTLFIMSVSLIMISCVKMKRPIMLHSYHNISSDKKSSISGATSCISSDQPKLKGSSIFIYLPYVIILPFLELITLFTTAKTYELISKISIQLHSTLNHKFLHELLKSAFFSNIDALKRVVIAAIMFIMGSINFLQISIILFSSILVGVILYGNFRMRKIHVIGSKSTTATDHNSRQGIQMTISRPTTINLSRNVSKSTKSTKSKSRKTQTTVQSAHSEPTPDSKFEGQRLLESTFTNNSVTPHHAHGNFRIESVLPESLPQNTCNFPKESDIELDMHSVTATDLTGHVSNKPIVQNLHIGRPRSSLWGYSPKREESSLAIRNFQCVNRKYYLNKLREQNDFLE